MKKIAYNAPEMEIVNLLIESSILNVSDGAGNPAINEDWGNGEIPPFPDDDDLPS